MLRILASCAALAAVSGSSILAQGTSVPPFFLSATYSFTLSEKCTHQLSANTPGFDPSTFALIDPMGAQTYSGASNGLMVFDGAGGVTIQQGLATNLMNASNYLAPPPKPPQYAIPFGFGLGPALPFTCTGTYTLTQGSDGFTHVNIPLTCNAKVPLPNALGTSGFQSEFTFQGILPTFPTTLVLTDIGNTIQPVTIFFPGPPASSVMQQRVCTRAATLTEVSGVPTLP